MLKKSTFYLVLLSFLLAACTQESAPATPTPTEPVPTATAVVEEEESAQATVAPTPTAAPTNSPPTPTPIPTVTSLPPTPTPTPVSLLAAEDFGENRNPFTGELVDDPEQLQRRPIAVKISNSPPEYTRPQAGISQADLVFEHPTEGPITRFTAIFYSQTPPDIGPIRSARLIDVELPAMYDAALAYSGSSIGVSQHLFSSDFVSRILRSHEPGYYRTGADKPWEHTLHADPTGLWQALDEREENHAPSFTTYMSFTSEPPPGGEAATEVIIEYQDWTVVEWKYDEENGRYLRWADGEEHTDANNGEQISAANVVLIYAIHQLDKSICESQVGNVCHAFSTEIQLWDWGDAIILRDGQRYDGIWERENRSDMLTFYDDEDNPIPLQIGNTWFQVVPYHYSDPVTITP